MKVLLLEDYDDGRIVIQKLLESEGYEVDSTATKKAALQHLESCAYNVGLIDLWLPDAKNLEAFDAIHAAAPDMPIVILSALDDPSIAVEAMKRGASAYLKKSVDPNKLLERLAAAIACP